MSSGALQQSGKDNVCATEAGVADKLGEIFLCSVTEGHLSGVPARLYCPKSLPATEQGGEYASSCGLSAAKTMDNHLEGYAGSGSHVRGHGGGYMGPGSHEGISEISPGDLGRNPLWNESGTSSGSESHRLLFLVGQLAESKGGESMGPSCQGDSDHKCQPLGMRSPLRGASSPGEVVGRRSSAILQ